MSCEQITFPAPAKNASSSLRSSALTTASASSTEIRSLYALASKTVPSSSEVMVAPQRRSGDVRGRPDFAGPSSMPSLYYRTSEHARPRRAAREDSVVTRPSERLWFGDAVAAIRAVIARDDADPAIL